MDQSKTFEGERDVSTDVLIGGSSFETITGIGAAVLSILALIGVLEAILLPIAIIAAGAGLLFQGSSIAAGYSDLLDRMDVDSSAIEGGTSSEIITGLAGIALGILALIGLIPILLMAISAIVLGCGLVISSKSMNRLKHLEIRSSIADASDREMVRKSLNTTSGADMLMGLAAIVLGILTILEAGTFVLTTIGILVVGVAILMSGLAVSSSTLSAFGH